MLEVNRAPISVEEVLTTPHYLSEGVLGQLALAFLLSPVHTDPGLVAPLVALYALREDDRRAMLLYVVMTAAACPVDLQWLSTGGTTAGVGWQILAFLSLLLKLALIYPAIKAHDVLPSVRPSRVDPATLQQKVVGVVETALREERCSASRPRDRRACQEKREKTVDS